MSPRVLKIACKQSTACYTWNTNGNRWCCIEVVSLDGLSLVAVETCTAKNARSILSRRNRPCHDHAHRVLFLANCAPLPVLFIVHVGTFCPYRQYVLELDAFSNRIMRSWCWCVSTACVHVFYVAHLCGPSSLVGQLSFRWRHLSAKLFSTANIS